MTLKQKLLSLFYPLLIRIGKQKAVMLKNELGIQPTISFHTIPVSFINRKSFQEEGLKRKKILIVNTASDCGYTAQYGELQQLYNRYKNRLIIIAVPSNDFKQQEKKDDNAILHFCQYNYGVQFPLTKKSRVRKGNNQHPLFEWFTNKNYNGWNDKEPGWNFSKYLVNEDGVLTHYFDPAIAPLSEEILSAIAE